jgi:hypothetical protein
MKVLALLVLVHLLLRLFSQPPLDALASTIFLIVFVLTCHRWGGWTSIGAVAHWFAARPLSAWLVGSGVTGVIGLAVYNGQFTAASIISEAIGAYFFFHAFCAVGDRLVIRLSKS